MNKFVIDMQPVGRRIEITSGESILDAARAAGVGLISLCGGEGWCGSCLVRIIRGEVNPPSQSEVDSLGQTRIAAGYRLACQVVPRSDVRVDIPAESLTTPQRLQVEGKEFDIPVAPIVKIVKLKLAPPGLQDLQADAERVIAGLVRQGYSDISIPLPVLKSLSGLVRQYGWTASFVIRETEVISILPLDAAIYGIAVDLGTTKVAVYLVDLQTGEIAGKAGEMNPQIAYGEDVISRISYSMANEAGRKELQQAIVNTLNAMIADLCDLASIQREQLVDAVIVGNTAMHHLFTGLPVDQLVFAPYVPALSAAIDLRAKDLGVVMAPGACIHLFPIIAGYVGADHAAVILSTELWKTSGTVLAVDIGTNTEISLVYRGKITSCSCASGPAFEGAHISHGMRAAPGAIEKMQIKDGEIKLFTIDDKKPVGICGSGILDIVAEIKKAELINEKGAFTPGAIFTRPDDQGRLELLLIPASASGNGRDIKVSRKDINEILLAKAAIRSGIDILLAEAGVTASDIDQILVAGAFGTYISVPNAIAIGMFPDISPERFHQIGNAAGMGAVQALISRKHRVIISDTIHQVGYIELTTFKQFQSIFMNAMYLK